MHMLLKCHVFLCAVCITIAGAGLKHQIRYMTDTKPRLDNEMIWQKVNNSLKIDDHAGPYLKAGVNVYTQKTGAIDYCVVYLYRADVYLVSCYKLEFKDSRVVRVIEDYIEQQQDAGVCYACPDQELEALFSTCITEVGTAREAIEYAAMITQRLGMKTKVLLFTEETVANIKNYLQCPKLAIWGTVCHGNASIIQLDDGSISYTYFQGLGPSGLKDKTIIINSCLGHTAPFEPAMLSAGTYFFGGGDTELQSTFSENVFKAFIYKAVEQKMEMAQAFTKAEEEVNYFGYGWSGDASGPPYYFKGVTTPYMIVLVPAGSEEWGRGSYNVVKWQSNIQKTVKIDLLNGTTSVATLVASTANTGIDTVYIPDNMALGDAYKIKISGVDEPTVIGESKIFKIVEDNIITQFPYKLDFDQQLSLPTGWVQEKTDDFDWFFTSGPTPSRSGQSGEEANKTGPLSDHTTGSDYYLYTEASSNNPAKAASLVTTKFDLRQLPNPVLSFWTHMFSAKDEMGSLSVDVSVDGVWYNEILSVKGNQGDKWIEVAKDLNQYVGDKVCFRLRGITGKSWCSDIAIDDFKVSEGITAVNTFQKSIASNSLRYKNATLLFQLPENCAVDISLYSVQGRLIYKLVSGPQTAGIHAVSLLNRNAALPSGTYICIMKTKGFGTALKIVIQQ